MKQRSFKAWSCRPDNSLCQATALLPPSEKDALDCPQYVGKLWLPDSAAAEAPSFERQSSITRLLRSLCGTSNVLMQFPDEVSVPRAPVPTAIAILPSMPGLAIPTRSISTDSFMHDHMVGMHSATPRSQNHQPLEVFKTPVSHASWLLPGQVRRSPTCPLAISSEKRHSEAESIGCEPVCLVNAQGRCDEENHQRLRVKWQNKQDWLEQNGRSNCGFINPEKMLQHQQRSRSLQMLVHADQQDLDKQLTRAD